MVEVASSVTAVVAVTIIVDVVCPAVVRVEVMPTVMVEVVGVTTQEHAVEIAEDSKVFRTTIVRSPRLKKMVHTRWKRNCSSIQFFLMLHSVFIAHFQFIGVRCHDIPCRTAKLDNLTGKTMLRCG